MCERVGRSVGGISREMGDFQMFVDNMELIDLPMVGRKFTWVSKEGSAMSRLDRFLLSTGWLSQWLDLTQWGLNRSVSHHCPILLKYKVSN